MTDKKEEIATKVADAEQGSAMPWPKVEHITQEDLEWYWALNDKSNVYVLPGRFVTESEANELWEMKKKKHNEDMEVGLELIRLDSRIEELEKALAVYADEKSWIDWAWKAKDGEIVSLRVRGQYPWIIAQEALK